MERIYKSLPPCISTPEATAYDSLQSSVKTLQRPYDHLFVIDCQHFPSICSAENDLLVRTLH